MFMKARDIHMPERLLVLQLFSDRFHFVLQGAVLFDGRLDFVVGMEDGSVVFAAEFLPDFWQGTIRQFTGKIHGDLPRHDNALGPFFCLSILQW